MLQARLFSRVPAAALVIVNSLVFAEPPKAFAEACEADNSLLNMNMPLLLFVALVGATVGGDFLFFMHNSCQSIMFPKNKPCKCFHLIAGLLARQRKAELQRLNEQLRQINTALRRQAKIESYAPSLSYVPVSGKISEDEVIVDSRKQDLISHLKSGKNFLRNQNPEMAFSEFKTALELAQTLKDPIEQKKAARGLGNEPIIFIPLH